MKPTRVASMTSSAILTESASPPAADQAPKRGPGADVGREASAGRGAASRTFGSLGWAGQVGLSLAVGLITLAILLGMRMHALAPAAMLSVAAAALCWVACMLWRTLLALLTPQDQTIQPTANQRRRELEREKYLLLKALRELDDDHQMGKLSQADYEEAAVVLRQRAARVLAALDRTAGEPPGSTGRNVQGKV